MNTNNKMRGKIIIYTNETCPYCKQIKEKFNEKNIEFEDRITKDYIKEWESIINLTGMPTVPTVKYNGEYFVPGRDFPNPERLINILENFKVSPDTERDKIWQRFKTLNYNITVAFSRLDQLLKKIETKINTDEHKSTD